MPTRFADRDIQLLRLFAAIVEAGGFSAAQAHLNVSASSISMQMAELEARLGMRLCQRGRLGFRLTDKGKTVYEATRRLFAGLEEFRAEVGAMRGRLVGALQIGLLDNMITNPDSRLPAAIEQFRGPNNEVHITLHVASPTELERAVLDGRMQAAIGVFYHRLPGLTYRQLFVEEQTLYCGRGHPLFARASGPLAVADLREAAFATRGYMEGTKFRWPVAFEAAATAYNMEALATLVLSGRYIAYLPTHYAAPWVERGQMRPLLPRALSYHSAFEVITRKGAHRTLVLRSFLDRLEAAHRDVPLRGQPFALEAGQPRARGGASRGRAASA